MRGSFRQWPRGCSESSQRRDDDVNDEPDHSTENGDGDAERDEVGEEEADAALRPQVVVHEMIHIPKQKAPKTAKMMVK